MPSSEFQLRLIEHGQSENPHAVKDVKRKKKKERNRKKRAMLQRSFLLRDFEKSSKYSLKFNFEFLINVGNTGNNFSGVLKHGMKVAISNKMCFELETQLNGQRHNPGWIKFRYDKFKIPRWREIPYKDRNTGG